MKKYDLPTKIEIINFWKDKIDEYGILIDCGEPSCWACGFHYDAKYDIRNSNASWQDISECWKKMPLQRCHIVPKSLGGSNEPINLFLMCSECHDLAPDTAIKEIFFEWVKKQSWWNREYERLDQ